MKFLPCSIALLCLFIGQTGISQSPLPNFSVYSDEEINLKAVDFDKDAEAIVLLDEATSSYDDEYQLITTRRVRIKILNDKGIDRGNIQIPYFSKDNFEFIRNVRAVSYSGSGFFTLERKSIYTEKVNDRISKVKFAIPNVRAGTIIEYSYESVMKHYGGLDRWIFQSDIPTLRSCYLLQIVPNAQFNYSVTKKRDYPIVIDLRKDVGQVYFEMKNIPGLKFEPYMDAPKDYYQQVEFQLSGFVNSSGGKQSVYNSWKDISVDLSNDKDLGGAVKKDIGNTDELKALVAKEITPVAKMELIYNYVGSHLSWNGYNTKYAQDGLKKAWEKKTGTAGEINLILINLLQSFDIDAIPLLVAERDFGEVDPAVPFIDHFNKTVAYVDLDGKTYILDATQKFCPIGITPYPLLNTLALKISRKTPDLISIKSGASAYFALVTVHATLDKAGLLRGTTNIENNQYAKQDHADKISDGEKAVIKKLQEENANLGVDSFSYKNLKNNNEPLIEEIKFSAQNDQADNYVLLNYNLFTGLSKNIFTRDERFTNIDFGYPYHIIVDETIDLPGDARIEEVPADKKLVTPDKEISILRKISKSGNTIQVHIDFTQTVTKVLNEDYPDLKNFYTLMVKMLNEPITIKMSK